MLTNHNKSFDGNNIDEEKGKIIEFPEKFKECKVIITNSNKKDISNESVGKSLGSLSKKDNIVKFQKKNSGSNLPPKPTIIVIFGLIVILFAIWSFTHKNSQEIFIGDISVGVIKDTNISVEEITDTVVAKLQKELGTNVLISEEITLKSVHSSGKDIVSTEYILSEIAKLCNIEISASAIVVNGKEIAVVKNEYEASNILNSIASKYISEDSTLLSKPTFQNVEIIEKFVLEDDIISSDTALSLLDINAEKGQQYAIQSGDTLYEIAINANMSMDELLAINPDLTENSVLKIGQEINLIVPVPLLSISIEEEVVYTEVIPRIIETVENNEEYKTYRQVISAGSDGSKEVTAKITKVNGIEQSREVISEIVLVEPTVEKVEVGTLTTPPKKAIGSFIYPVTGANLTSGFGERWGTLHAGIDLACSQGTPVKASDGGVVVFSGWNSGGYGYMIKIDHGNGFYTVYAHNSKNIVTVGQNVAQGEVIGYVGNTGNSTGSHLHFEIVKDGVKQNPINYLK